MPAPRALRPLTLEAATKQFTHALVDLLQALQPDAPIVVCRHETEPGHDGERLLNLDQVAERLAFGKTKVRSLIASGELEPIRVDGSVRVRGADLDRYIRRLAGGSEPLALPTARLPRGRRNPIREAK